MTDLIFVYGSLIRAIAHPMGERLRREAEFVTPASVAARLYKVSWYPAVKLGGVLDCALRHRLKLIGVANGQRVPEDWVAPQAEALVDEALSAQRPAAFEFDDTDLSLLLATSQARAGSVHA